MPQVRLLKGYNGQPPGTILDPKPDDCARLLVNRGIAEYVEVQAKASAAFADYGESAQSAHGAIEAARDVLNDKKTFAGFKGGQRRGR